MPSTRIKKRPAQAASLLKHFLAILAVLVVAGCSGGGCGGGGCSSCGGVTALPNGFTPAKRIENAGSVRLTQSGLGFLQSNVGTLAKQLIGGTGPNGLLTFNVPTVSDSASGFDYTVCPGGPNPNANPPKCVAEIDVGSAALTITPAGPYDLHITGNLPLRLRNLPLHLKGLCAFGFCAIDSDITATLNGDGACPGGSYDQFPVNVDIAIHVDQNTNHTARVGYSQVKINQVIDTNAASDNIKNHVNICGGALAAVLDFVKTLFIGSLTDPLINTLTSQIDDALCAKASATTPCPAGTTPDGSQNCRYPDNTCASTLLGTDGHIDLGGLLASVSPGTTGGLDFLFAAGGPSKNTQAPAGSNIAWGDLNPVNNGATLGMFGGAEANPLSKCVKMADIQLPTGIPIPDELAANTVTGWPSGTPGPHVGIALSERFANYALGGLYNSGLLCIGISTESVPQLTSGTLGLVAASSKNLGLAQESQQIAMVIRPGAAPTVAFGNGTNLGADALLNVDLKDFSIDFYIWSLDRFIRMLTATYNLTIPVNLVMGKTGLAPQVGKILVNNGKVTNSQLLREDPATLASALGSVLSGLVGQQLGGAIKPIDINSSLASTGLELIIPDTVDGQGSPGLRKLSKGTDNFLGIFAALALAGTGPTPPPHPSLVVARAQTNAEVVRKTVDRAGLSVKTINDDNAPVIDIRAVSALDDGTRAVEYSYKVDNAWWSPWTRERNLRVRDDWMRMQGRHVISVRSREAGRIDTEDDDPAEVEVIIDTDAPRVKLALDGEGNMTVDASDTVTEDNLVRYQINDKPWSSWILASRLGKLDVRDADLVKVEAQDAEGNVGTAQQELIRGRGESVAGAGCGCAVVGTEQSTPRGLWLLAVAIGGVGARLAQRHRQSKLNKAAKRALQGAAAITIAATWQGCSCGNDSQTHTTSTGSSTTTSGTGGAAPSCDPNVCTTLEPGLIGSYSSVAVSGNDLWVAGYSEGDWDNSQPYGDLVAGKWDGDKVVWEQVDGVPTDPPVDPKAYNTAGFRGGQTEPGDDVGLWTSIAVDAAGNPAIAYFDRTHEALKFAQYDGKTWAAHTVEAKNGATIGRYAKMLFLGGNFVIAYQSIEGGGTNGAAIAKVRIATSSGAKPTASSWTFEDAAVDKASPCRGKYCATGQACVASSKVCTATATVCNPSCASGQACVGAACVDVLDKSKIDAYPDALGDYVAMAPDGKGGFGLAYYDRPHGDVYIAAKANGKWTSLQVDGQNGDVGMGASLFIDGNGDWHVTYANGASEGLQYVKVAKGTTVGAPETVDDGLKLGTTAFADGQHIVGDDSHVFVLSGGEVHVTYQDATSGTLRHAVGAPAAGAHTWKVKAATQTEFAGAFSNIVSVGGKLQLMNWWRVGGKKTAGDVRVLPVP